MTPLNWTRYRFWTDSDDYRPIKFPPPGPYWCSGSREGRKGNEWCIVAYFPVGSKLKKFWPEAKDIQHEEAYCPQFTSRFPRPDWYKGDGQESKNERIVDEKQV